MGRGGACQLIAAAILLGGCGGIAEVRPNPAATDTRGPENEDVDGGNADLDAETLGILPTFVSADAASVPVVRTDSCHGAIRGDISEELMAPGDGTWRSHAWLTIDEGLLFFFCGGIRVDYPLDGPPNPSATFESKLSKDSGVPDDFHGACSVHFLELGRGRIGAGRISGRIRGTFVCNSLVFGSQVVSAVGDFDFGVAWDRD